MKKIQQLFVLLVLFSVVLGIRIYWLSQKEGLHVDEGLSVTFACYNEYMYESNYEFNRKYTGKEVKEISLCDNGSFRDALEDIYRLWKNNRDDPHTNLYYSFLRLSLAGLKTGDIRLIILRGGILNLILFSVSFVFFFLLMKLLFPDSKLLQFSATFCTFLSTATISNTLFLRPYQIQETMFIIFCYFFFKTFELKKWVMHDNKLYINTNLLFSLSIVTAFALLTGYYTIIFIGLFGLYVISINYKKSNFPEIKFYIMTLCLGLLFAQAFYSKYFVGYISGRSRQTVSTLFGGFFANIAASISSAVLLLQKHFFTYPVVVVCALCLFYLIFLTFRKQKFLIQKQALYVLAASLFYFVIIMFIAPYKLLRYIMPVFPFFIIFPAIMINSIGKWKISAIVMLLLCAAFFRTSLNHDNIENLYRNKPEEYNFTRDVDTPVFVLNKTFFKYNDMVPYFNDKQVYYFIDNYKDIALVRYNELYLVTEAALEKQQPSTGAEGRGSSPNAIVLEKFKIEQEYTVGYFTCKKMKLIAEGS